MGFLDLFGKKSDGSGVRKHAERVANKRAQAFDRWEAIGALARMKTPEAVEALLPRFTFYVEPSITDQEEKDAAFNAVVESGDAAVEPVTAFLCKAESISWPVKMLDKLVAAEVVIASLLGLLGGMDTEYQRSPERKIQVLTTLGERKDPRISNAAVRFVTDANETVRFAAVAAVLSQDDAAAHAQALVEGLCQEESVRVRNRILEALAAQAVSVVGREDAVKARLTPQYQVDKSGIIRRRA